MANVKRPAERTLGNKGKKARTSNSSDDSPKKQQSHDVDDSVAENVEPASTPFSGMIYRLQTFQGQASKREKWALGFKERVDQSRIAALEKIEEAKAQIQKDEKSFQNEMLLIITSLTTDFTLEPGQENLVSTQLQFEAPSRMAIMNEADTVTEQCESLISAYQTLCGISASAPAVPTMKVNLRQVFAQDQAETTRAFEASKKLCINRLQARFADRLDKMDDGYTLDATEVVLANRVMSYGKAERHREEINVEGEGESMGSLLYGFVKVAGKMQGLVGDKR